MRQYLVLTLTNEILYSGTIWGVIEYLMHRACVQDYRIVPVGSDGNVPGVRKE